MDIERNKFEVKKELLLSIKGKTGKTNNSLKVGDLVRVRPTVIKPSTKWGNKGVSHASIGRIKEFLKGPDVIIDFPEHSGWNGKYYEMERVQSAQPCDICDILLPQLPKFCKYENDGCEEIQMKEDMVNHEQECVFREIDCPELSCYEKVTYMSLMDHLGNAHKNCQNIVSEKFKLNPKMAEVGKFAPTRITAFKNTFFEVGIIKDQQMFRWIYFLGDPDVAKNFFYHVKLKKENSEEELNYFKYEDILASYNAFVTVVAQVKNFLDGNGNLTLEYKIRNMKAEAKDEDIESGISDNE